MTEAVLIGLVFLLAGAVKGVIGLGLPTVSLGLLTAFVGLEAAMVLMLAPSFATNLWQAVVGGQFLASLRRTWIFMIAATATVWIGVSIGAGWDIGVLSSLLGALLVAYGTLGLVRPSFGIRPRWEMWAGPLAGGVNGILTGLTGSFVVPGVFYLQSLALTRDQLVQAMGILFTLSTLALAAALGSHGRLPFEGGLASTLAILPAVAGMMAGARIRKRLSEAAFRCAFLWSLVGLGLYILVRAIAGAA